MKLAVGLAVLLLSLVLPADLAAQTVEVDWVHGIDFHQFHTFTWAIAAYPIQDPDANLGMAQAVQQELEAKGVRYTEPAQRFDVFVTYNAKINQDPTDLSRQRITLKLHIFDSRNNNIIWRAGGYVTLGSDKQQNRENARALIAAMLRQYPPPE